MPVEPSFLTFFVGEPIFLYCTFPFLQILIIFPSILLLWADQLNTSLVLQFLSCFLIFPSFTIHASPFIAIWLTYHSTLFIGNISPWYSFSFIIVFSSPYSPFFSCFTPSSTFIFYDVSTLYSDPFSIIFHKPTFPFLHFFSFLLRRLFCWFISFIFPFSYCLIDLLFLAFTFIFVIYFSLILRVEVDLAINPFEPFLHFFSIIDHSLTLIFSALHPFISGSIFFPFILQPSFVSISYLWFPVQKLFCSRLLFLDVSLQPPFFPLSSFSYHLKIFIVFLQPIFAILLYPSSKTKKRIYSIIAKSNDWLWMNITNYTGRYHFHSGLYCLISIML